MAQSMCRTCSAPLEWRDTEAGRRPFNPDGTPHRDQRNGSSKPLPVHDRQIAKLAVLKAAAAFCAGKALNCDVKSTDVLKIAEAWLEWVEA